MKRIALRIVSRKITPDYLDDKHQLVLGTTGAGKTSYINEMAKRTVSQDDVLVIIDGKADTGDYSLLDNASQTAADFGRDLVILNGTENPNYNGRTYNPFLEVSVTQAKDLMMSLLEDDTVKKSVVANIIKQCLKPIFYQFLK